MGIELKRTSDDVERRESSDSISVPVLLRLPDLGAIANESDEYSNASDRKARAPDSDVSDSKSSTDADDDNDPQTEQPTSSDSLGRGKSLGVPVLVGLLLIGLATIGFLFVTDPNIHGKASEEVKSTHGEENHDDAGPLDEVDHESDTFAKQEGDNATNVDRSIADPPSLFAADSPVDEPPAFETPENNSPAVRSAMREKSATTEGSYPSTDPSTYIYPSDSDSVDGHQSDVDRSKRGGTSEKQPGMATLRGTIEPPPQRDRARR